MPPIRTAAALLAFAALALPAAAAEAPYAGRWDCEVSTFAFTETSFDFGDGPQPATITPAADGTFEVAGEDGPVAVLQPHEDGTMTWLSPNSGDVFECRRP
jgi:hypothetical protein